MRDRLARSAVLVLAACSFILQDVNEGAPPERPPTCSPSFTYGIVDGVITVGAGVGFVTAVRCNSEDCLGRVLAGIFVAVPVAIVYGLSAIYGVTRARRCERARLLWTELVESRSPPPPPPVPDAGPPAMK